ncbi:MAG: T9SS type A sorting domain-containing protein [Candidatus Krumholzibacteria bacterium]|nr:T9SS type A sorting domain-containing protein [Candidatus Krumholzibacteria bacterium]MDH4338165.1 T9SS type A sorting domain-containing protein [Candidatus Krumholzibacteria bacterium]MDH5270663.1 T9SS type A sorting domain-containing protein [Candidatus Krumholzibacteria bacterium]MDH5627800.1 T9SS type A sorting domain-containing protein [Candidatus Krumholzibacteria bacterium]
MKTKPSIMVLSALAILSLGITPAMAQQPVHLWSHGFGGTSWDQGTSIAVDADGNVIIAGSFQGTMNLGGGNLTSAGDRDIFLAQFGPGGAHQWSKSFGGTGYDEATAVAVDPAGYVLVTGRFENTINFGGGALISAGGPDIFLARFGPTGGHNWSKRFGSTGWDEGLALVADISGGAIMAGAFEGAVQFGNTSSLYSAGGQDIFVARYSASGSPHWAQSFGGTASDRAEALAMDSAGDIIVTGIFAGTVDFGGGGLVSSGYDAFVAKYTATSHQWSQRFGNTGDDIGTAVATDGDNNVVVAGSFQTSIDLGGGAIWDNGGGDIFFAGFNGAGVHQWSQGLGGSSVDEAHSLVCDPYGGILLTGYFWDITNFGGDDLASAGYADVFLARFTSSGAHQWSTSFGSTGYDYGLGVALSGVGKVHTTGMFQGAVDFGGGVLTSAGSSDIFVARYGPEPAAPFISSIEDIGNDQGRLVKVRFVRSGFDVAFSSTSIVSYELYRRDDPAPAFQWGPHDRSLRADGWTFVGSVPAHAEPSYGIDAPTIGDSTISLGDYYSTFFVRAAAAAAGTFYDSAPDSGYSIDNLAPGVPAGLAYNTGTLTWDESRAEDFDYFTVYGANTQVFGAATVVDYCVAPTMDITAAGCVFYFVTATDFSGNEGAAAMINTASGVGGTPKDYVLSVSAYPNPFNPSTTVRYTLPARGRVTVAVYDARGARVATLVDADQDAGAYTERWDGRDGAGRTMSSGVYFVRVDHPAGTKAYKMVLLK